LCTQSAPVNLKLAVDIVALLKKATHVGLCHLHVVGQTGLGQKQSLDSELDPQVLFGVFERRSETAQ
jgi:hypothetical protein